MVGSGVQQFLFAALTIEHAHGGHFIVSGADHVVASVSDHDGLRRIDVRGLQRVTQELGLVDASAIQFGAEHALEIAGQIEVLDNALGLDMRLAGGDE